MRISWVHDSNYVPLDETYGMLWDLHRRSERWVGLEEVAGSLRKKRVFQAVRALVKAEEPTGQDEKIMLKLIEEWHLYGEAIRDMMPGRGRKLYLAMKIVETIYRAGSPAGYVWTLDKKRAEWMAKRDGGKVYTARLNKRDITFVANDKKEAEVMVLPENLFMVSEAVGDGVLKPLTLAEQTKAWVERGAKVKPEAELDDEEMIRRAIRIGVGFESTPETTVKMIEERIKRMRHAGYQARPDTIEAALAKVKKEAGL